LQQAQEGRQVDQNIARVIEFYSNHPISCDNILSKLASSRGSLDKLRAEDLFPHDQDHYSGLEANDQLARHVGLVQGARLADFGAGLGGPARYFAHQYAVKVMGIELTPVRVVGAKELTQRVGLQDRVCILSGDMAAAPLRDSSVDAVVSQESLLHVANKRKALAEAYRILRKGGRLAFTDWVSHKAVPARGADLRWAATLVTTFPSPGRYEDLVRDVGFQLLSIDDPSEQWRITLTNRLAAYQTNGRQTHEHRDDAFERALTRLLALVEEDVLGGIRVVGEKR
jgi:sarcosine/dimethylglycine N-methyltransferase